jgi:hypothetical protein
VGVFLSFGFVEWVLFAAGFLVVFGALNGFYKLSRLYGRGSLPIYFWILNGLVAILIAASFAQRAG